MTLLPIVFIVILELNLSVNNYQNGFILFSVCMLKTGINCKTSTSSQTKFKCMY